MSSFPFQVMSFLDTKTTPFFYFSGGKATTPSCPVEMLPNLNPSIGAQIYTPSDANCSSSAKYYLPFFLENLGPRFSEWTVTAHEARPGHHTQVSFQNLLLWSPTDKFPAVLLFHPNYWQPQIMSVCHFVVLTSFWLHLWPITEQTHGSVESICFCPTKKWKK